MKLRKGKPPVYESAMLGKIYRRLYSHLSDDELHSFYASGFIMRGAYEFVCAERGLRPRP